MRHVSDFGASPRKTRAADSMHDVVDENLTLVRSRYDILRVIFFTLHFLPYLIFSLIIFVAHHIAQAQISAFTRRSAHPAHFPGDIDARETYYGRRRCTPDLLWEAS